MNSVFRSYIVCIFFLSCLVSSTLGKFQDGETVTLWVNKVDRYNNPQETYNYYSLPFYCPAGNPAHKWGGLGEVLGGGDELIDSQIEIKIKRDVERTKICEIELEAEKTKQFKDTIGNPY